ncbi:MAG: undecaprenyldiphospho-muramoylpentapeptide beta-N-acetylglucosaminyltransferase [Bdellovibrionales bacterium]
MTEYSLIVLAAGGTGGHIFPAEALARELLGRGLKVALMTDKRGCRFGDDLPVPTHRVCASSLGRSLVGKAFSIARMGTGVLQAILLLRKLRPTAVVGFGGYPSIPTLFAAARMGIPIILHDQNAVLGQANLAMMNKARIVATSFSHIVGIKPGPRAKVVLTGNPVRPAFVTQRATPYKAPTDDGAIRLLVMGGSLGAHVFSEVVPAALGLLPESLRRRIVLTQQCRAEDLARAKTAFAGLGIEAELSPFFRDVPERMAAAHLVIGRAGGSTVAELTVVGRPAIFVPFPHGHAGEQTANAEALAEAGGAWLIPQQAFTPEALAVRLETLFAMPTTLAKSAAAARALGKITAADSLADCVMEAMSHR